MALPMTATFIYSSYQGPAIVRQDGYKVRYNTFAKDYDMYFLPSDPQERTNIASSQPEIFQELKSLLLEACDGSIDKGRCNY